MVDDVDLTQARQEAVMDLQLQERLAHSPHPLSETELSKLIQQGRDCVDCDEPIAIARLKANPHAVRCIDCQQLWEQKQ